MDRRNISAADPRNHRHSLLSVMLAKPAAVITGSSLRFRASPNYEAIWYGVGKRLVSARPPHHRLVVRHHVPGDRTDLEVVGPDLADRRHLGRGARDEHLVGLRQLVRLDRALDHL